MKFLAPIAFAVLGSEVAALSLKTKTHHASHVAKTEVESVHHHAGKKAHHSKALTRGMGFSNAEASVTLVAFLTMYVPFIVNNIVLDAPQKTKLGMSDLSDVVEAYDWIGGYFNFGYMYTLFATMLLEIAYVVMSFVYSGDANSGDKNGLPNDLASWNQANKWPVWSALVLQGLEFFVANFIKVDYSPAPAGVRPQ